MHTPILGHALNTMSGFSGEAHNADGVQRPVNVKNQVEGHRKEELFNRRAGVEPVIGHAKKFGLGKSRMKSDEATLASGYRSVTGFNLHQLVRKLEAPPQLAMV